MVVSTEAGGVMVSDMGMGEWSTGNQNLCILETGRMMQEKVMEFTTTHSGDLCTDSTNLNQHFNESIY